MDDPDLDVGGHPLVRALIRAVGDMSARTTERAKQRNGNSPTEQETELITKRLLNTPMIRSLLVAFAKEIVDDQDVLEAIEEDANVEKEKRKRNMDETGSNNNSPNAPSTGSSTADLSSDGGSEGGKRRRDKYQPRAMRPRGSIYDKTGTIRDLLQQKMTPNLHNLSSLRVAANISPSRIKWTLRLRVQIHSARGLVHCPGVQLLDQSLNGEFSGFNTARRGSMSMSKVSPKE